MTQQPDALKLADKLEKIEDGWLHVLPEAAAELRRLHEELEAAKRQREYLLSENETIRQMNSAVKRENESLRDDAERYRFVKNDGLTLQSADGLKIVMTVMRGDAGWPFGSRGSDTRLLDAAIDAARKKGK